MTRVADRRRFPFDTNLMLCMYPVSKLKWSDLGLIGFFNNPPQVGSAGSYWPWNHQKDQWIEYTQRVQGVLALANNIALPHCLAFSICKLTDHIGRHSVVLTYRLAETIAFVFGLALFLIEQGFVCLALSRRIWRALRSIPNALNIRPRPATQSKERRRQLSIWCGQL